MSNGSSSLEYSSSSSQMVRQDVPSRKACSFWVTGEVGSGTGTSSSGKVWGGVPIYIGESCSREAAGIDGGDGAVHADGHFMSVGSEMG